MSEVRMTKEEFLAGRKAAGRLIDVETCRIWSEYCEMADPYGVHRDCHECVGMVTFVASLESDGPVRVDDLPEDKQRALDARIDRMNHTPTTAEGVRDVLVEEYNLAWPRWTTLSTISLVSLIERRPFSRRSVRCHAVRRTPRAREAG